MAAKRKPSTLAQLRALKRESREVLAVKDAHIDSLHRGLAHERKEVREAQARYEAEKRLNENNVEGWQRSAKALTEQRDNDRAALLTAENRVFELEHALVSLAVRLA